MKIEDRQFVSIDYKLTLDSGEVVDRSEAGDPLGFVFGAGQIIRGLEKGLLGMEAGQTAKITVEPGEGYGEPQPNMLREIPRENFPADLNLEPGMSFTARGPHGPVAFRVKSSDAEVVLADFNHPLAGQTLHFEVTVAEVREPRAEELASLMQPSSCGGDECSSDGCSSCGCSCGG
ncbi:MAG: peptidylprolyl isomerase [Deltaproteobacteria bacterium]|nr:peptidylprolyl isomerase [Deltaproteobacteria bacterium]